VLRAKCSSSAKAMTRRK